MAYFEVRLLSGGTYTAGTDWFPQFESSPVSALGTLGGEIQIGGLSSGVCCSVGLLVDNPISVDIYVEADATHPVQIQVGDQRFEYAVAGHQTIEIQEGGAALRAIREVGPVIVFGLIFGPSLRPVTLYAPGADPIQAVVDGMTGMSGGSTLGQAMPISRS